MPSFSQAQRMKKLSQDGKLNDDAMLGIMMEQKKPETWDLKLPMDKIRKYFPRSYTKTRVTAKNCGTPSFAPVTQTTRHDAPL